MYEAAELPINDSIINFKINEVNALIQTQKEATDFKIQQELDLKTKQFNELISGFQQDTSEEDKKEYERRRNLK